MWLIKIKTYLRYLYINKSNGIFVVIVAAMHAHMYCDVVSDIDECVSAPCQNGGQCYNELNQYSCTCEPGFVGTNCEKGKSYK